jgi:hypothetical protein
MNPKQKAEDLIHRYRKALNVSRYHLRWNNNLNKCKKCARIAVEEIQRSKETAYPNQEVENGQVFDEFWNNVKTEIEKL